MANPEHVAVLRRGSKAVVSWRGCHRTAELDLSGADLRDVNLQQADLSGANLARADLSGAQLSSAHLEDSRLDLARLAGTKLVGAQLTRASLRGTLFNWTRLRHADMTESVFMFTCLVNVDLSEVLGLDTVRHCGPSEVGLGTLLRSKGKIPPLFLRGCGVPEIIVRDISRISTGGDFEACFISYTEADEEFSRRLYGDLQNAGVLCWRWPEDAEFGKDITSQVDEAIKASDRLVVILSTAALRSEPVVREIVRALQKEQRDGKEVLFPVRLDDSVFQWEHGYQADLTRRFIGDFTEWRDPNAYREAFDRLVRALRR